MKRVYSRECYLCAVVLSLVACSSDDTGDDTNNGSGGSGGTSQTTRSTAVGAGGTGGSTATGSQVTGAAGMGVAGSAGTNNACESPEPSSEIAIHGAYRDVWQTAHVVSDAEWRVADSRFHVLEVSNEESWLVAENDTANEYNPGLFSRFEWTEVDGALYYCQSVFAAETAEQAESEPRAAAGDLAEGCGGFSWTELHSLNIVGNYVDSFDGSHNIMKSAWLMGDASFRVLEFSNEERWLVAQNDCDNQYNPGLFSRFEWVSTAPTPGVGGAGGAAGAAGIGGAAGAGGDPSSASIFYCQIGYDLESADAALALDAADASDLAAGCNGFAWTELSGT